MASVVSSCILCLCLGWYGSVWYGMVRCWLVGLVVSLCVAAFFFCIRAQSSHTHLISFVKTSVKSLEAQCLLVVVRFGSFIVESQTPVKAKRRRRKEGKQVAVHLISSHHATSHHITTHRLSRPLVCPLVSSCPLCVCFLQSSPSLNNNNQQV
jgi:hypothetical protein